MQELARGIVNINEEGAFGTPLLKPPMMRTIDLYQLTKAITPTARLMQLSLAFAP